MKRSVVVIGAGGWGTALAVLLARGKTRVTLWVRRADYAEELRVRCENVTYLPGVSLDGIEIDCGGLPKADLYVMAVPTQHVRETLGQVKLPRTAPVVSVSKGIEMKTLARPSEILAPRPVCVLSGPSHAAEVARFLPTSVVAASGDERLARDVQAVFMGPSFRVYTSDDVVGVEFAGALKNIIAIAAGICDALKLGDNAKSALMARGLVEIARLGTSLGGKETTFFGLAGLGDLITTCYSPHGRNLRVGRELGAGKKLDEILASMRQVAEGVWTSRAALELAAKRKIEMPITQEVVRILFEGKPPRAALSDLMSRTPKSEFVEKR